MRSSRLTPGQIAIVAIPVTLAFCGSIILLPLYLAFLPNLLGMVISILAITIGFVTPTVAIGLIIAGVVILKLRGPLERREPRLRVMVVLSLVAGIGITLAGLSIEQTYQYSRDCPFMCIDLHVPGTHVIAGWPLAWLPMLSGISVVDLSDFAWMPVGFTLNVLLFAGLLFAAGWISLLIFDRLFGRSTTSRS